MEHPLLQDRSSVKAITFDTPAGHQEFRKARGGKRLWKVLLSTAVIVIWGYFAFAPDRQSFKRPNNTHGDGGDELDFEEITPSEKLEWHPCFRWLGPLKCARLTVPMDYNRPLNESESHPKVHIALVLAPGNHSGPKKYSQSPLLINPGGPGGSGVSMVVGLHDQIKQIVGAEQDVIGFDPRGIAATTPRADCFSFPSSTVKSDSTSDFDGEDHALGFYHRMVWMQSGIDIGAVNSSSDSLAKLSTRAKAVAKLCEDKDSLAGKDSIMRYIHTPSVARDMISIIDAWDEWTKSLDEESAGCSHKEAEIVQDFTKAETSPRMDTKGKLVYWGFSYGTLLGATFASMFPDRVGRVILDGVVDADHYVAPVWAKSIRDADTIFNSLPKYCHQAGKSCALYRENDDVSDIRRRIEEVLEKLKEEPLTLIDQNKKTPVIFTISTLKLVLFGTLYAPTGTFPAVAGLLDLMYRGDYQPLAFGLLPELSFMCSNPLPAWAYPTDAQSAIMCSDKRYPLNETLPNLQERFDRMANISSFADIWMTLMVGCESWGIEAVDPPMRWDDHPAHKQQPIKTSFPLLFLSNTADPVTPLAAGVKMAEKFVDAGLVEQNSMGHCSLAAVSICTIKKIRAYFQDGLVPPPPKKGGKGRELIDGEWDKCEADEWPFHPYDGEEWVAMKGEDGLADVDSMDAISNMQKSFRKYKFFGQSADFKTDGPTTDSRS